MKTIKIIDLLNMISKGEEVPKKIVYSTFTYWYDEVEKDYYRYVAKDLDDEDIEYLLESCFASDILNEEIQIIDDTPKEKKIPEKIGLINYCEDQVTSIIHHKVNEIIDYLDYLESKGE